MCTLSLIRPAGGLDGAPLRLAFNRDELRTRPPALPPRTVRVAGGRVVMPIDPQSGGTWIAASDAGLVFAVLNVNPPGPVSVGRVSRGLIVPRLLGCHDLDTAVESAERIDPGDHAPFRLVIADAQRVATRTWDGAAARTAWHPPDTLPLMFTSSGLGDCLVDGPRQALFARLVIGRDTLLHQDRFHRHRWRRRPELSVWMERADARTVSFSVLELASGRVTFRYADGPLGTGRTASQIDLPIRRAQIA